MSVVISRTYMKELGAKLFDQGFHIIPIRPTSKAPAIKGWSRFAEAQTLEDVEQFVREFPGAGIGVLTAYTPVIDIDIGAPRLQHKARLVVERILGTAPPMRIGRFPRCAFVCRADKPFSKLRGLGFRLPGDQEGAKAHCVEILGDGQQMVAYGIHPDTKQEYEWPRIASNTLPDLTYPC